MTSFAERCGIHDAAREQADKVREKVKPIDSKLVVMGNNG